MTTVAFLGPPGTFTHEALRAAAAGGEITELPEPTVLDALRAVEEGRADLALMPIENSTEGSVRATLDALAFEASSVMLAGEVDLPIRHALIAREPLELGRIERVISHPQATAQCARFIRESMPGAELQAAASTTDAIRTVGESAGPWAAIGPGQAAELYGCVVVREGIEDESANVTRFVWVAPEGTPIDGEGPWRTTIVIAELHDRPGALVDLLREFSDRGVNLSRIESRPMRGELGRYMFFCDLEGAIGSPPVSEALREVREKADDVRVLGSYPVRRRGIPGAG